MLHDVHLVLKFYTVYSILYTRVSPVVIFILKSYTTCIASLKLCQCDIFNA